MVTAMVGRIMITAPGERELKDICPRCGDTLEKVDFRFENKDFLTGEKLYHHILYCGKNIESEYGNRPHFLYSWSDGEEK